MAQRRRPPRARARTRPSSSENSFGPAAPPVVVRTRLVVAPAHSTTPSDATLTVMAGVVTPTPAAICALRGNEQTMSRHANAQLGARARAHAAVEVGDGRRVRAGAQQRHVFADKAGARQTPSARAHRLLARDGCAPVRPGDDKRRRAAANRHCARTRRVTRRPTETRRDGDSARAPRTVDTSVARVDTERVLGTVAAPRLSSRTGAARRAPPLTQHSAPTATASRCRWPARDFVNKKIKREREREGTRTRLCQPGYSAKQDR